MRAHVRRLHCTFTRTKATLYVHTYEVTMDGGLWNKELCPYSESSCSGPCHFDACLRCQIGGMTHCCANYDSNIKKRRQERTVLVAQIANLMRSEKYDGSPKMLRVQKQINVTCTTEKSARRLRDWCTGRLTKLMLELDRASKDKNKADE